MILVQHGRGGWVNSRSAFAGAIAIASVVVTLVVAGCSSKKPGAVTDSTTATTAGTESGINPSGGTPNEDFTGPGHIGGPLSDIHFGYNDYTIQEQDGSVLKSNASWMQAHPLYRVQVEGFCDERGSEEYNLALGARRAQAAKDYLVTLGIADSRLSTTSYGKELPICTEHEESCWAQNRRDHFAVRKQ
jgi:peptidoglycan-associated lipoprotein